MYNHHLNIFEYYSQKGVLPIENNSTRNLAIVLKSDMLCFDRFLDLISTKCTEKNHSINIEKPKNDTEYFINIQKAISKLAQQELVIENIIGATLTTQETAFYSDELELSDSKNITDMIIYSNGTLIIIEAKRDAQDATNQLEGQLKEFISESVNEKNDIPKDYIMISLVWENIVEYLYEINLLTKKTNLILDDYIDHIKNSVPAFFPVFPFNKLTSEEHEHIEKRIERFAINTGLEPSIRGRTSETLYWIVPNKKQYIREYVFRNYDNNLELTFYPGSTIGQGNHLYNENNNLSILNETEITVFDTSFKLAVKPNIGIRDARGRWKFDIPVDTTDSDILKELYNEIRGRKLSVNNNELINKFEKYRNILSIGDFTSKYSNYFKNANHNYTFLVSITIGISIEGIFPFLQKMDIIDKPNSENDFIVSFANEAFDKVCYLIEN